MNWRKYVTLIFLHWKKIYYYQNIWSKSEQIHGIFSSVSSHFVKIKRMQFWNKNPKYALIVSQPYEETRTKRFAAEEKRGTSILSVCNILCEDFPKGTSILSSKWSPTVIHLSRLIIRTFVCVFVSVSENKIFRTFVTFVHYDIFATDLFPVLLAFLVEYRSKEQQKGIE